MSLRQAEQGLVIASNLGAMGQPMRDVALSLVHDGWPVFPCGLDKAPLVPTGFKARTRNVQQVEQWWALHPEALPAICPGDNGLAAFDVDSAGAWLRAEGVQVSSLRGLIVESGGTSQPFTTADGVVRQPRHVYVRSAQAPKVGNVVVRFLAGYVIAPGARRGEKVYTVTVSEEPREWTGYVDVERGLPEVEAVADPSRLERVRALVAAIPNPLETDREKYIAFAHMVHGAVGEAGRDLFLEWAGRWPGKVNRAEDERVWDTLPPSQLGFDDLWVLASKYTDTAAEQRAAAMADFEPLADTPKPEPDRPKSKVWFTGRELLSQPELLAIPTPSVPYLAWPGRKTLFAGREKSGKSTLAFAAVSHMTRGEAFLGVETTPQRVLWVTEESLQDVATRIQQMGTDLDRFAAIPIGKDPWQELAEGFREFAPQVVVIDSLAWFAGLGESEENNSGAWMPVFKNFDKLTRAGVALLLLHHSLKSSPSGSYRGSTAIGAAVEAIIEMETPANGNRHRNMSARSRMGIAKSFNALCLDDKRGLYKLTQGVEEAKEASVDDQVVQYLLANPGSSLNAIVEGLGRGRPTVVDALARLGTQVVHPSVAAGWSVASDFTPVEGA